MRTGRDVSPVQLRLDKALRPLLEARAEVTGRSKNSLINEAVAQYLGHDLTTVHESDVAKLLAAQHETNDLLRAILQKA